MYWKKYERTEKEQRRKAEKEATEQRKIDDEMREVCVSLTPASCVYTVQCACTCVYYTVHVQCT